MFDAIHDQAQPARVLENIYRALRPGGVFLMADIKASSRLEDNVGVPMSTYLYTISMMHCMTVSLALDGAGLGTAWGTQLATSMLADAGFDDVAVAEIESDPINNYYIARMGVRRSDGRSRRPRRLAGADGRRRGGRTHGVLATHGDTGSVFALASVTKPLVARAAHIAVEEGVVDLDTPAGPPGSTVRHLLAHASGLAMHSDRTLAQPGTRRMYSNYGFTVLAETVQQESGIEFGRYLTEAVFEPLGMSDDPAGRRRRGRRVTGRPRPSRIWRPSPATCCVRRRCPAQMHADATTVQFPGLDGVLPGYGVQRPNDWGLGFEIRDAKSPHWTGARELGAHLRSFRPSRRLSSGQIPRRTWRWWCSRTAISATGRWTCGRRFQTRCIEYTDRNCRLAQHGYHKAQ